jgi:hypothetical protein
VRKPNEILNDLEGVLRGLKQVTLTGPNFDSVDEYCTEWLKLRGYSVKASVGYPTAIKKHDDLITLFYSLFQKHYPNYSIPYGSSARDRKIMKLFVESRMSADCISKAKAMEQCATIIEVVFRNKEAFNFDPAPNIGIFGQQNMAWVTNKALGYINKELKEIEEKKVEKIIETQTAKIEKEFVEERWTESILDEILNN